VKETKWSQIGFIVLGLIFFIFCFSIAKPIKCDFRVSKLPLENVVQVKVEIDASDDYYEYSGWQGSGVFIDDNLILTAGHVVDMTKVNSIPVVKITDVKGNTYEAVRWYKELDADVGFILVDTNDVEKKLKFDNAKLGEEVWTYGNPFGVFPVLTKGIISATNAPDDFKSTKKMVIIDAAINGGNSGCPVFDRYGNILGICSWGYRYSQGMSYFVRSEVIKLSLEKYKAINALEKIE